MFTQETAENHFVDTLDFSKEEAKYVLTGLDKWKDLQEALNIKTEKDVEVYATTFVVYLLKMYWLGRDDKLSSMWQGIFEKVSESTLDRRLDFIAHPLRGEMRLPAEAQNPENLEKVFDTVWNCYKGSGALDCLQKPKKPSLFKKLLGR